MGWFSNFFSLSKEFAMDLGTANTIIIHNDQIVVDEPSVVALNVRSEQMEAVGERAKQMHEKTNKEIRTVRPLHEGVIADFQACEQLIRGLINMAHSSRSIFSPFSLCHLSPHLRGVNYGKRVTNLNIVTLLNTQFYNPAWHFARHTIFSHFYLSLYRSVLFTKSEEANQCHYCYNGSKAQCSKQYVVMLRFL